MITTAPAQSATPPSNSLPLIQRPRLRAAQASQLGRSGRRGIGGKIERVRSRCGGRNVDACLRKYSCPTRQPHLPWARRSESLRPQAVRRGIRRERFGHRIGVRSRSPENERLAACGTFHFLPQQRPVANLQSSAGTRGRGPKRDRTSGEFIIERIRRSTAASWTEN